MINMKPFRFWVQSVLPIVYEDSLSYYELLSKVVKYINCLIEDTKELTNGMEVLKEYVDNYFDNLNVQEEVNEKLDEMAESGELQELIGQYLEIGVKHYQTALDLIDANDLSVGNVCYTLGYYTVNDGGSGHYVIVNGNDYTFELDSGLKAKIITNGKSNIKAYGCKSGEECTDLLAKCFEENTEIYIPEGTYIINETLYGCGKHIYGEGCIKVEPYSQIKYVINIEGTGNTKIEGIEIDGSSTASLLIGCIENSSGDYVDISNVNLHHTDNYWFEADSASSCCGVFVVGDFKSVSVTECYVHDIVRLLSRDYVIASCGIAVTCTGSVKVNHNTIERVGCLSQVTLDSDAIHIYNRSNDFSYKGASECCFNVIKNCTTRGIKLQKPNCLVRGNHFTVDANYPKYGGICGIDNQAGGCVIENNFIITDGADSRNIAIVLGGGTSTVIRGNICDFLETAGTGIEINAAPVDYYGGCCYVTIEDNVFKKLRRAISQRYGEECDKIYITYTRNSVNILDTGIWSQASTVNSDLTGRLYLTLSENINVGNQNFVIYPVINFSNYVCKDNVGFYGLHSGQWDWNKATMFEAVAGIPLNPPTGYVRNNFVRILSNDIGKVYERYNDIDGYYIGT